MSARECIIPVFVPHLGCPHACVFCNQNSISGAAGPASAEMIRRALSAAASVPHPAAKRQLAFYGGSFTAIPAQQQIQLLSEAAEALSRGEIDAIRLSTRPDAIDPSVLERLRQYGVKTIEIGAQSMDDSVLARCERGHTAADTRRASLAVKEAGFRLILQMMTGLPGSDDEKDLKTARLLADLRPDGVRIYPTVILRGTQLYEQWREGIYREHTVEDAVRICAKILPIFETANIPVIRLGLNPSRELSDGEAAGGAYHPALGELVRSRVMLLRAETLLNGMPPCSRVTLGTSPETLSQLIGRHQENLNTLRAMFSLDELKVKSCQVPPGEIRILSVEQG